MSDKLQILGIEIGDCEGWDQFDTVVFAFTSFRPTQKASDAGMPKGDLTVDYEDGFVEIYDPEDQNNPDPTFEPQPIWRKEGKELVEFLLKVA